MYYKMVMRNGRLEYVIFLQLGFNLVTQRINKLLIIIACHYSTEFGGGLKEAGFAEVVL